MPIFDIYFNKELLCSITKKEDQLIVLSLSAIKDVLNPPVTEKLRLMLQENSFSDPINSSRQWADIIPQIGDEILIDLNERIPDV